MTSGFCFVWRGWRAVFGAFVGLGLIAFGFTGSAQAQLKEADYALPDELPPCLAFEGEPSAVRADCERLILDDATLPGVRRLARFQRARIVHRDDDAKLVEALKPFDFTGAPFALRGYTSVPVGQACYRLGDYECTRTNYDLAMFAGRLNYYGMRAYAEAIHKSDPPIDYVARLASFVKREQEGKTELAGYSQNLMIVMAALLELKDRQSERKDTLIELGRAKISDAAIANEVCWSLVTDLAAAFDAQMACNAAVRLAPGNGSLLDSRAVMHFALGDFESAVADFERALTLAQESALPTYKFGLSLALDRRGRGDDKTRAATLKAQALAAQPALEADFAKYTIYEGKP